MGKYSSGSDSVDSYKKNKKKSRHRSSSASSSSSRYSSSRSKRKKCVKKYKKRSGRSRSKDRDRKSSRPPVKHSRDRDRERHSRRSRSHSYSASRSPGRSRHRSKESDAGSTRRSKSRERRRRRSRSRSPNSRRRSKSKDRRARDDGAELLEKLNKAAVQAMADNSKLREATINLVNQVAERESAILEIKASNFAPKSFSSSVSDKRSEEFPAIIELPEPKSLKIDVSMKEDPKSLLHPNLLLEDTEEKLSRWIRKIYMIRQRSIRGEPLAYG